MKQIEEEKKAKGATRRSAFSGSASEEEVSEDFDEFEKDDKYGCIL